MEENENENGLCKKLKAIPLRCSVLPENERT